MSLVNDQTGADNNDNPDVGGGEGFEVKKSNDEDDDEESRLKLEALLETKAKNAFERKRKQLLIDEIKGLCPAYLSHPTSFSNLFHKIWCSALTRIMYFEIPAF